MEFPLNIKLQFRAMACNETVFLTNLKNILHKPSKNHKGSQGTGRKYINMTLTSLIVCKIQITKSNDYLESN